MENQHQLETLTQKAGELQTKDYYQLIGESLGDYKISKVLGSGGMGVVYRALQKSLGRNVALKLLTFSRQNEIHLKQLMEEAKIIAQLQHPNIVTIHVLEEDKGRLFFVMDLVEGETLEQRILKASASPVKSKKLIPLPEVLSILSQVASALSYAHEKKHIIHRDIKPANIMIDSQKICKVMDFGLAKIYSMDPEGGSKILAGTPAYMSPEQIQGKELDPRTDIFSLGVVFYEMLMGENPFKSSNVSGTFKRVQQEILPMPSRKNPNVPPDLDAMIFMMTEKDREDRYRTMAQVLEDIEKIQQEKETWAYEVLTGRNHSRRPRKGATKVYALKKRKRTSSEKERKKQPFSLFRFGVLAFLLFLSFLVLFQELKEKWRGGKFFPGIRKRIEGLGIPQSDSSGQRDLQMARNYVLIKRPDLAEPILRRIIKNDPDSESSAQAEKLLMEISK